MMRRRWHALIIALALLSELAMLCCGCVHVGCHAAPTEADCAVCRLCRALPRALALPLTAAALLPSVAVALFRRHPIDSLPAASPVALRVRLDD